jgi:hypothetical protein
MDFKPVTLGDWYEILKLEDFVPAASLLANKKKTPDWVAVFLMEWAPEVIVRRDESNADASRELVIRQLSEVKSLSLQLSDLLSDATVIKFLQMPPQRPFDSQLRTRMFVSEIAARAHGAVTSGSLVRGAGKENSGAGKAVASDEVSPEQLCAIIISEVWHALHGAYQTSGTNAAEAATAYWSATGGTSERSFGSSSVGKWASYFRKARDETLLWGKRKEMKRQIDFHVGK